MEKFLTAGESAAKYLAQAFEIKLLEELTGRISVTSLAGCGRVSGKWQLEIDGERYSFGQFLLNDMRVDETREFLLSVDVPDMVYGSCAVLIVRLYDEDGVLCAEDDFDVHPAAWLVPPSVTEQYITGVRYDVSQAIISSGKLSAVIDANGMRELRYNGEKIISGGPRLSLWQTQMVPEELAMLKLDRIKVAADRFVSDGRSIECHALALPKVMEVDELEFTQRFTPQNDGSIRYDVEFVVPESFAGIPRLGVLFRIPAVMEKVTFFGNGPHENYPGTPGAIKSKYTFDVKDMYVPGSFGSVRSGVRKLKFTGETAALEISCCNDFAFSALPFSDFALEDAAVAGKLPVKEFENSVHIDCRHAGGGNVISAGVYRMTLFFK
ncbi:MAG: hypothetical protein E7057_10195 [Lentisphaerae bacterium]|nr:hypothetical protein [Lentisphaerota bacterium]